MGTNELLKQIAKDIGTMQEQMASMQEQMASMQEQLDRIEAGQRLMVTDQFDTKVRVVSLENKRKESLKAK